MARYIANKNRLRLYIINEARQSDLIKHVWNHNTHNIDDEDLGNFEQYAYKSHGQNTIHLSLPFC